MNKKDEQKYKNEFKNMMLIIFLGLIVYFIVIAQNIETKYTILKYCPDETYQIEPIFQNHQIKGYRCFKDEIKKNQFNDHTGLKELITIQQQESIFIPIINKEKK